MISNVLKYNIQHTSARNTKICWDRVVEKCHAHVSKIFLTHCSETLSPSGKRFLGTCRYRFSTTQNLCQKSKNPTLMTHRLPVRQAVFLSLEYLKSRNRQNLRRIGNRQNLRRIDRHERIVVGRTGKSREVPLLML